MAESFWKQLFRKIDKACYRPACAIRSRFFGILCKILLVVTFLVVWDFVAHQEGVVRTWVSHAWNELLSLMGDGGTPAPPFEVAKSLGLLVAAFLGLGFTAWRAFAYDRQTVVAEQGHLTERFNKAAEQLGSEHMTVRIAAINALWRIGVDSKSQDDKRAVLDVLCGFVREYRPESLAQSAQVQKKRLARALLKRKHTVSPLKRKATQQVCPPDVQTVLDFLGKRMDALHFKPWRMDYAVDLSGAYLAGCNLSGYSLRGISLHGANLCRVQAEGVDLAQADLGEANVQGANLTFAHLAGAKLWDAYLVGINLGGAHLDRANLGRAHLNEANLFRAHLDEANLGGAHLDGASLEGAHLVGADLLRARLAGANLRVAHLDKANLNGAHLAGADLSRAHLNGSDLSSAHLEGANLWSARLERAIFRLAHLEKADLRDAHLDGADLSKAHLDGADLRVARLNGANFFEAHLNGTDLRAARLEDACLWEAHFDGANLKDIHLNRAALSGAIFKNARNLRQKQIDAACWDGKYPPTLPPGFTCPPNYCEWDLAEQKVVPIDPPDAIAPCPAKEPDE
ncbi:pentapeptide repeat-containing protein [Oceanidesulfovibrio marinus]|nr:pentapeptide repeat-containing protein [Oceanidesulfovibrio marinus]